VMAAGSGTSALPSVELTRTKRNVGTSVTAIALGEKRISLGGAERIATAMLTASTAASITKITCPVAIVLEIARQHFATVRLEDAHPGQHPPGTLVSLRFDANESERRAERPRA